MQIGVAFQELYRRGWKKENESVPSSDAPQRRGRSSAAQPFLPALPQRLAFLGVAAFSALALALRVFPRIASRDRPLAAPPWEIFLRMAAATVLMLALTGAAQRLGPQWSGILTPFPIFASVLPAFTHHRAGGAWLESSHDAPHV